MMETQILSKKEAKFRAKENFNVDQVLPFYCHRVHKLGGPWNTVYKLSQSSRVQCTHPAKTKSKQAQNQ